MPGWKKSTEGATSFDDLPKKAQAYLRFVEQESGAKIGMVSTGPDRDQTMMLPEFAAEVVHPSNQSPSHQGPSKEAAPQKGVKTK